MDQSTASPPEVMPAPVSSTPACESGGTAGAGGGGGGGCAGEGGGSGGCAGGGGCGGCEGSGGEGGGGDGGGGEGGGGDGGADGGGGVGGGGDGACGGDAASMFTSVKPSPTLARRKSARIGKVGVTQEVQAFGNPPPGTCAIVWKTRPFFR